MRNKHLGYKNKQIVAKYQNRMCSRYVVDFQYSQWGQLLLIFEGFSSIIFYDGKHTTSIYQYTFTKHTSSKYIFLLHMSCGCLVSLFLWFLQFLKLAFLLKSLMSFILMWQSFFYRWISHCTAISYNLQIILRILFDILIYLVAWIYLPYA